MQRSVLFTSVPGSAVYMRHGMPVNERPELAALKTLPTTHLEPDPTLARYLPTAMLPQEAPAFSEMCDSLIERRLAPDSRNSRSSTPASRPAPLRLSDCSIVLPSSDDLVCGTPLNHLYDRKVATAKALLEQLEVSYERHQGLKNYLTTQKEQLRENAQLACAELQSKRNALVAQIDAYLHEATKAVQISVKEKERLLSDKDQEVDIVLDELGQRLNLLHLATTAEAKSKFVQEFASRMEEAESALKLWIADCELPADFCDIQTPKFAYALAAKDSHKGPLLERDVNREKDATPIPIAETRLGTTDKPILSSHSRRHRHKHSKVPKLHLPEDGENQSFEAAHFHEQLMRQNKKLMRRLE